MQQQADEAQKLARGEIDKLDAQIAPLEADYARINAQGAGLRNQLAQLDLTIADLLARANATDDPNEKHALIARSNFFAIQIRARDGGLHLAAELHAHDEHGTLVDPAATPDREFYRGDAGRWRALFVWLGLGADPPPALLLRELDGLLARHADDPAGARVRLDALFVHVQRRWPGLAPADAELLASGLRARAWLPAVLVSAAAVV